MDRPVAIVVSGVLITGRPAVAVVSVVFITDRPRTDQRSLLSAWFSSWADQRSLLSVWFSSRILFLMYMQVGGFSAYPRKPLCSALPWNRSWGPHLVWGKPAARSVLKQTVTHHPATGNKQGTGTEGKGHRRVRGTGTKQERNKRNLKQTWLQAFGSW